jgi:hypothetical protein
MKKWCCIDVRCNVSQEKFKLKKIEKYDVGDLAARLRGNLKLNPSVL